MAKTILNDELIAKAGEHARNVVFTNTLADLLGVHRSTLYRWLSTGKASANKPNPSDRDRLCIKFRDTIKKSLAEAECKLLGEIRSDDQWQAKAWILERRWPERWGLQKHVIRDLENQVKKLTESLRAFTPTTTAGQQSQPATGIPEKPTGNG